MAYRFNPNRAAFFAALAAVYFVYRWASANLKLGHQRIWLDEWRPVHYIVVLAVLCITVVGLVKLWVNSRDDDPE